MGRGEQVAIEGALLAEAARAEETVAVSEAADAAREAVTVATVAAARRCCSSRSTRNR